ncbi:hypothetical protein CGSHi6P18H1_01794 [Haemophilus influenzae 6P18H1]|nr:hypothetical protein CGSHi6P18H1_01794 [Haemophilus influenzae 6P18H1]
MQEGNYTSPQKLAPKKICGHMFFRFCLFEKVLYTTLWRKKIIFYFFLKKLTVAINNKKRIK